MNLLSEEPELERIVTERLSEVLQRISDLEESKRQKDIEISVLRHALENVFRTIDLYKEKLKKLPKSKCDQTNTCGWSTS
jgi:light-regulated signal transduction histidine kinase (bacteriophytochrome)